MISKYLCFVLLGPQINPRTHLLFFYILLHILHIHVYIQIDKELKNFIAKAIIYYNLIWKPNHLMCYKCLCNTTLFIHFYNTLFEIRRKMSLSVLLDVHLHMYGLSIADLVQLLIKDHRIIDLQNKNNCRFLFWKFSIFVRNIAARLFS